MKIWSKFTGEHPCRSEISIKLLCNFIEITRRHGCPPVNLLHIFGTPFLKTPLEGCFWNLCKVRKKDIRAMIFFGNFDTSLLIYYTKYDLLRRTFPAGIYMLKVNNRNTRTKCEICWKLTIKTPERRQPCSSVWTKPTGLRHQIKHLHIHHLLSFIYYIKFKLFAN